MKKILIPLSKACPALLVMIHAKAARFVVLSTLAVFAM